MIIKLILKILKANCKGGNLNLYVHKKPSSKITKLSKENKNIMRNSFVVKIISRVADQCRRRGGRLHSPVIDSILNPIRMRQKYTRVNILWCANFTRGKEWCMRMQIHTRVYLHMGKFTPGSDQMQILFLQIRVNLLFCPMRTQSKIYS